MLAGVRLQLKETMVNLNGNYLASATVSVRGFGDHPPRLKADGIYARTAYYCQSVSQLPQKPGGYHEQL